MIGSMELHLKYSESGDASFLLEGITEEALLAKPIDPIRPFSIFIVDQEKKKHGGVTGVTYYGCLYIDMLFVDKPLRSQGWGAKLMSGAEKIGKEHRCTFATVNTMDWEALPFYQRLGYEVEFIREGYQLNSKMFMLRKQLH